MKLRIAHVLPSFAIGGQERVALDLARTQRSQGHDVTAFAIDGAPEGPLGQEFRESGVEVKVLPKGWRVDPFLVVRLAVTFAWRRIQVVHTHNPMALIYGAPAGRLASAAVVHTKHGENPEPYARRFAVRRAAAVLAHAFVAVSPKTADAARATRDVPETKLRVITNGIDLARFGGDRATRDAVRRELGIPEHAWVVGTIGRLAPEKNQTLLVRALRGSLRDEIRLVIVGDGPERDALARTALEAGVAEWVHLTGARSDAARMLASFDAFALPSTSEGLPLVVLEAMASGLPVVASAVGGVPDVVTDGQTGHLVPPGDAEAMRAVLLQLAGDRAHARGLGSAARRVALARHSLERMSSEYMELYQRLARGEATASMASG